MLLYTLDSVVLVEFGEYRFQTCIVRVLTLLFVEDELEMVEC